MSLILFPCVIDQDWVGCAINPAHVVAVVPGKAQVHRGRGVTDVIPAAKVCLTNGGVLLVVDPDEQSEVADLVDDTVARLLNRVPAKRVRA